MKYQYILFMRDWREGEFDSVEIAGVGIEGGPSSNVDGREMNDSHFMEEGLRSRPLNIITIVKNMTDCKFNQGFFKQNV